MNPRKPRFSIAAKRIWPLFVAHKGWPFDRILETARSYIGKRVVWMTYGLKSPPKLTPIDIAGIEVIDTGGTVYTGKSYGDCDATVRFLCCRIDKTPPSVWHIDAAELYESEVEAVKELAAKAGVVAQAFDAEWTNVIHCFNRAREALGAFEKWERYYEERGLPHPIRDRRQRGFIEGIRASLRSYKEGGEE